jgi:hypothetical protein
MHIKQFVMYECKNIKSDEFREIGRKNHVKQSSGSEDMSFGSLQGQNGLFRRFWGNFGIFGVVGGALAEFGIFSGISVDFLEGLEWFRTYM